MVFIASTVAQRKARIYRFMQSVYRLSDTHATPCAGVAWLWDFFPQSEARETETRYV